MKYFGFIIFLLAGIMSLPSQGMAQPSGENRCIACHLELESDAGPAHDFAADIHSHKGLGCQDCHGGNPELDDMDRVKSSAGWRGVPKHSEIPNFCARCHSNAEYMHEHNPKLPIDQLDKYKTSIHGQRFFQKGDQKVATCVSCHTAHKIGDATMPHSTIHPTNIPSTCGACHSNTEFMAEYGIPTNQEKLYRSSVHGIALFSKNDLSAPVCNDCHGNHGAAPPGANSLSAVCGMCHAIEADLFLASPHFKAFADQGLPMCETCHGNHGITPPTYALIGLNEGQICANCHSTGEDTKAPEQIDQMSTDFKALTASSDTARNLVTEAGTKGMMITDIEFSLKEINQILIHMRSAVHSFAADSLTLQTKNGLEKSTVVQKAAADLIHEYYFRRWGLGISSCLITLFALGLYLKIRSLDKTQAKN
jgi:predicted CXXCH cytochrome family protein